LRVDEPERTSFSRTPSFAWAPVPGADHYEFQLSLSTTFRDNAVVYADLHVPTPVLAPNLTLPWITGNPHSLYARVRAVLPTGATDWSAPFGFDMVAPAPPTPLPSYPGLLRWTPIEGAAGYQVWLVDVGKMETVTTNVLDEREFYTFHQSQQWLGTVRWRIRVIRLQSAALSRINGIPAGDYGPWSTTYVSTNPDFVGGPLKLVGTVSDVFSDGAAGSPSHRLMPAFLFTGNTGLSGTPSELFRVEVFTDRQCLNRVFTGAVTGSPAYSPRPFGPLSLPMSGVAVASARNSFLPDGGEPTSVTPDGDTLQTTEMAADQAPTGTAPGAPGESGSGSGSGSSSSSGSAAGGAATTPPAGGSGTSSNPTNGGSSGTITWSGRSGAPTDLWDVDWPKAGYYWTVVPVSAAPPNPLQTSLVAPGAKTDDTVLPIANANGFGSGDLVQIGFGASVETITVAAVSAGQLTLISKLRFVHGPGEPVIRVSGNLQYHDAELAQDTCASGRVARFGKSSEPSLTASGELFATGLSSDGRLTSARHTTSFYGAPLVSWTPALGALAYEVQWSKTSYPFQPEAYGGGSKGFMTTGTSMVLPVGPGTWYYRVRGFDYSLPSGSQQMTWSDPAKLVVAKPTFKVIGGGGAKPTPKQKPRPKATPTPPKKTTPGLRLVNGAGFAIKIPSTWKACAQAGSANGYCDPTKQIDLGISIQGAAYQQMAAAVLADLQNAGVKDAKTQDVTLPAGAAVALTATETRSGHVVHELAYFVKGAGTSSWVVGFDAKDGSYAANLKLLGQIIGSFQLR
jgi:hypothetical protein